MMGRNKECKLLTASRAALPVSRVSIARTHVQGGISSLATASLGRDGFACLPVQMTKIAYLGMCPSEMQVGDFIFVMDIPSAFHHPIPSHKMMPPRRVHTSDQEQRFTLPGWRNASFLHQAICPAELDVLSHSPGFPNCLLLCRVGQ